MSGARFTTHGSFRKLRIEPDEVVGEFLAFLDGLWLRWCLSDRRDTKRELAASVRFLESSLGPLEAS